MTRSVMVLAFLIVLVFSVSAFSQLSLNQPPSNQMVLSNLASQPLCFTENRGQWDEKALFKTEAGGATFWFCQDEVVYQFSRNTDELIEDAIPHGLDMPEGMPDKFNRPRYKQESMVLRAQFVGANPNAEIVRENRLSHNNNYFIGNVPSKWATDVPNYSSITYKDIWPGIDLKYCGSSNGLKYDFIVNPGADISQIRIRYEGVDNLSISNAGDLEAQTRFGLVYENIPEIYQERNGDRASVSGRYRLIEPGVVGFVVDNYNHSYLLVIDPELIYSTYLGGNNQDFSYDIAIDGSGNAYVTGHIFSADFPTLNPYQTYQADGDVFVAKLSPSGNSLIYSTYIGGTVDDRGMGIAVDASGNSYVVGNTNSANFPILNPFQDYQGTPGSDDAFVTKLSPSGNSLVYSTYLGGNSNDWGQGIAIDSSRNVYVTGVTNSTNFPTQNPYQIYQAAVDAFVTKFSPLGDSLIYSTYLGGSGHESGHNIAVDNSGCAYVTGETNSFDFPTRNPYQTYQGPNDVFITKFSPLGDSLIYSTYLGGSGGEAGYGIAVDNSGCAYVTGMTNSVNFPVHISYQTQCGGYWDAFVTKLSPSGSFPVFSTYLGGNGDDCGMGIGVDGSGNAYVTGYAMSPNFPTQNPYQIYQAAVDAFVTKFSTSGTSLVYSTCLGGNGDDWGMGIAVDSLGNAHLAGTTWSTDFPTQNPYQVYQGPTGYEDAFVAKFSAQTDTPIAVTVLPSQNQLNVPITTNITATFDIDMDAASINETTFVVYGRSSGRHSGAIIYDAPSKTATLNPTIDFQPGELANVILTTSVKSSEGIPLEHGYAWSFTSAVNGSSGVFSLQTPCEVDSALSSVFAADFDGDGDNDLAVANGDSVSIFRNNGNGTFQIAVNYGAGSYPWSVFAADLDGDGNNDLAVANVGSGNVSILRNNGNGTFQAAVNYGVDISPMSVFACDLDGDGDNDLAVANTANPGKVSILRNNGNGTFQTAVSYGVGIAPLSVFACDLDGDGDNDLATANNASDNISILKNNGDGTFQAAVNYVAGGVPRSVFGCDLDGDGNNDLAVANAATFNVSILKNNGNGTFQPAVNYAVEGYPSSVFAADLDGDGDNDLAVANADFNGVCILKNNGNGTFQTAVNYEVGSYPYSVFAADLDGDGDNDLAVANLESNDVSILFNQGGLCDYLPGDINGDGFVRASDVTFGVRYLKGIGTRPPDSCYNDSTGHYLFSAADANGDCQFRGPDITYLVQYFKGRYTSILHCPQTPPTIKNQPIRDLSKQESKD